MGRIFALDEMTLQYGIYTIINVFILFFGMSYFLFDPVREFMKKRSDRIENDLDIARTEKAEALKLKREYEEKLKNINKEADLLLSEARKKALVREDEMIREAKEEANRLIERAKLEITREKEKVKDEIKEEIIMVASQMAQKFVAASMSEDLQNQLIEETLNEMGDETWLN